MILASYPGGRKKGKGEKLVGIELLKLRLPVTKGIMMLLSRSILCFFISQNPAPVPRTMRVLLAPHLPPDSLTYCIDSSGVHGIDVDDMHARTVITEATKPINDQYSHQPRAFS